jgi:hypothetical protein
MVNNILGLGLQGVQQGIVGMDTAARKIASAGVQTDSGSPTGAESGAGLVEPLVELRLYERNVQASSQVVKTANEMVGTLLDEQA